MVRSVGMSWTSRHSSPNSVMSAVVAPDVLTLARARPQWFVLRWNVDGDSDPPSSQAVATTVRRPPTGMERIRVAIYERAGSSGVVEQPVAELDATLASHARGRAERPALGGPRRRRRAYRRDPGCLPAVDELPRRRLVAYALERLVPPRRP